MRKMQVTMSKRHRLAAETTCSRSKTSTAKCSRAVAMGGPVFDYDVGAHVRVYHNGLWYEGKVKKQKFNTKNGRNEYRVTFEGYSNKYDVETALRLLLTIRYDQMELLVR
eukprot:m.122043 g.122043  ORF g.122043 m.122043 type:complete len:110 (-) comp15650_c0_seq16:1948-2277(-)